VKPDFISYLFGLLIGAVVGFVLTYVFMDNKRRDDAVESGHAEYYLDSKHCKQWRWKEAK